MNQMAGGMGAPSSDQTGIHSDSLPSTLSKWEFLYMMSHKTISSWQGVLFVKQMLNVFYKQIMASNMNLLWAYLFPCL